MSRDETFIASDCHQVVWHAANQATAMPVRRHLDNLKVQPNNHFVLAWKMIHAANEMSKVFNQNGNGTNGLPHPAPKRSAPPPATANTYRVKDSVVTFQTHEGVSLSGHPARVTRHAVFFELYNPMSTPRFSEALEEFKIILQDRTVYAGRAVILNAVYAGTKIICEATLDEAHWLEVGWGTVPKNKGQFAEEFKTFIREWQKLYKVSPDFKVAVADMQTFLHDLHLWLERTESDMRHLSSSDRIQNESESALKLGQAIVPAITNLFEKIEDILEGIDRDLEPAHRAFSRRMLHPMLLCSPFLYRTYAKPLGYAGDYEMVNMIMRDPMEGDSLYAKIINLWFVNQAPAEAHRNRIDYLCQRIATRAAQAYRSGKKARVLTLGCGPAHEVQRFLRDNTLTNSAEFFLIDFNSETLVRTGKILEDIKQQCQNKTPIHFIKKSVNQILKEAAKSSKSVAEQQYDLVYCAGLFDYLTDPVCKNLTNVLYDWVSPGGMLITTNVDRSNPRQITMDYIMDWHLIYRNSAELEALKPDSAVPELCSVISDETGVNIYFEAKKVYVQ